MKNIVKFKKILLRRLIEAMELVCTCVYSVFLPIVHGKARQVVIYYHSIKKQDVKDFERQMRYLAENYRVVKPSYVNTAQAEDSGLLVAITFDDAFASIIENALPVLKKYNLPAGIFVPTASLGQHPQWRLDKMWYPDDDEVIMSESQIAELSAEGFEFCSHTVSHAVLTELEEEKLSSELTESKKRLESITAGRVLAVSYPLGAYNEKVCRASERAGYEFGFTTEPCMANCSAGNMQIGRFIVKPTDSLTKFRLKVIGAYQISKHLRAAKALIIR